MIATLAAYWVAGTLLCFSCLAWFPESPPPPLWYVCLLSSLGGVQAVNIRYMVGELLEWRREARRERCKFLLRKALGYD